MGCVSSKSKKKSTPGDDAWEERDFDYDYSESSVDRTRKLSSSKGDVTGRSPRLRGTVTSIWSRFTNIILLDLQDKFFVIGDSVENKGRQE